MTHALQVDHATDASRRGLRFVVGLLTHRRRGRRCDSLLGLCIPQNAVRSSTGDIVL